MATVKFNYKIDGWFETVNYYRSETPMNINSMPPPLVTGITGTSCTDIDIDLNKTYYVRFSSISLGVERISDEITVNVVEEINQFIEPIYAKGEVVGLKPTLSNGRSVLSVRVTQGSLPTGWSISDATIVGSATSDALYNFTLEVEDSELNLFQKTFSVKIQGVTWSQLLFDGQNMNDTVSGNSWTQGTGNIFITSPQNYALQMGGQSASTLAKSMSSTTNFTVSVRLRLTKLVTDYIPIFYLGSISSNTNRDCIYIIPEEGKNILRSYRQAGTGTSLTFNSSVAINLNEWVDIAYEINGVDQKILINKQLVASGTYTSSISSFVSAYIGLVRANNSPIYRDGVDIENLTVITGASRYE